MIYDMSGIAHTIDSRQTHGQPLENIGTVHTNTTGPPQPPVSPLPRTLLSPMSPSIYSRDTDGASYLQNDSVSSFKVHNELERHHDGGSAVILTSQSVRSYVIGTPPHGRSDSTRSSRDWKAWLSHEVSTMELTNQDDLKIHEQYLTPSKKHRRDTICTSHTERDDTTVILRPSCDTATPQANPVMSETASSSPEAMTVDVAAGSTSQQRPTSTEPSALQDSQVHTDMTRTASPNNMPADSGQVQVRRLSTSGSSSILSKQRPLLVPRHGSSASQPLIETPMSARMNDRFPFIDTGRRSSNNSAGSSRLSRSPPDSVASSRRSSKITPSNRIYSDTSAPRHQSPQHAPNTSIKSSDGSSNVKENITPPSIGTRNRLRRPNISPLGATSHTQSLQPLSTAMLNRSTTSTGQDAPRSPNHSKHISSPAATPHRPRMRTTVSVSPEKLSCRPKSAFDLRGTRTSLPRPISEFRRPALHVKSSRDSFALTKEPSPGTDQRFIDSVLKDGERSGSITPGQRMADHFLRERKSAGLLEGEKRRGGLRLVREDTPAFL
jgi:hypothetical protein